MLTRGGHIHFLVCSTLLLLAGCSRPVSVERLNDSREVLSPAAESRIEAYQQSLLKVHDIELAVDLPAASPADLPRYSHDLMTVGRLGASTSGRRGLLLVIDVEAARVRLEVGPDLEHVFPDALVSRVENNQMAPFFREGRIGDGVEATVELLLAHAKESIEGRDLLPQGDIAGQDYSAVAPLIVR